MNGSRHPDLPILDELRAELRLLVATEALAASRPAARLLEPVHPPRRRRGAHGGRQVRRIARRTAIVFALFCLVGGIALAARFAANGGSPANTDPTPIGSGAGWRLYGYRQEDRLCVALMGAGTPASACGPPPTTHGLLVTSALGGGGRVVFGFAGRRVDRVSVHFADRRTQASTSAVPSTAEIAAAGIPAGTRWFAVVAGRGRATASSGPAKVLPLDGDGRPAGPATLDCSLGATSPACRHAIERRAAGAAR